MSGSAGLSPSRNRKPEDSTLSEYAGNSRKECADLVAGQAVLTAENKSAKEIGGLKAATLNVSTSSHSSGEPINQELTNAGGICCAAGVVTVCRGLRPRPNPTRGQLGDSTYRFKVRP